MDTLRLLLLGSIISLAISSCTSLGCTDEVANNYDAKADEDNGECVYNMGCTDLAAENYDADATKDDGTCQYDTTGRVVFWTNGEIQGSSISVKITRQISSSITGAGSFEETLTIREKSDLVPSNCDESESFVFTGGAGTYKYEANAGFNSPYKWEGEVSVSVGSCVNEKLAKFPDIRASGKLVSNSGGTDKNYIRIVNRCNYSYDITMSTGTAKSMDVGANQTKVSPILWDNDKWEVRINKKSDELGTNSCAGFYVKLEDIKLSQGALYEIIIGQ